MSRKFSAREAILDAAEAVMAKAGTAHLTLDAVAAAARVSKGGLLYHFPSKESLLQEMVARLLRRVDEDEGRFRTKLAGDAAADLQAHILAGFLKDQSQPQVAAALLAAGANDPKLLQPVRRWHGRNFQTMARTKHHPIRAAVIMMAMDGLWLNELLQTSPLNARERKQLMKELIALAKSSV